MAKIENIKTIFGQIKAEYKDDEATRAMDRQMAVQETCAIISNLKKHYGADEELDSFFTTLYNTVCNLSQDLL